ncbi:MAG: hypothetical protein SH856_00265 [Flavobacteriales bacterium]|mgnify:CR=1 FL=1|nr:hypothetical protein [Flavobacteriales bacterium]
MTTNRESVRLAVHTMLNDVIEQGFHFLVNQSQHSDEVNRIIKEATDELNYQLLKLDAHNFATDSEQLEQHFQTMNKDVHRKSLELLSRLQKIQIDSGVKVGEFKSD